MYFYIFLFMFCIHSITAEIPTTIVVFGATGDLSAKKVFPAIYNLAHDAEIKNFQVVGVGRRSLEQAPFQQSVFEGLQKYSREKVDLLPFVQEHVSYFQAPFEDEDGYEKLKFYLEQINGNNNILYYLATEPTYFTTIIKNLKNHGLLEESDEAWKRVIIEKPFGYDLSSAEQLCNEIAQFLNNEQMYLIDHYLGKDGVFNLQPLRFTNPDMDLLWNNEHIDNVQINLAEKIGIGTRGAFWEGTGLLRDVVQNHVIQMLALLAMEKPVEGECGSLHEEKVKVLNAIREIKLEDVVRGQYVSGVVDGEVVKGYLQENGVANDSLVETFIAARMFIDNERWEGVPFYIRAGKRLSKQATEIVITFKDKGQLYIRIQPDSTVTFHGESLGVELQQPSHCPKEAYECLLLGAINGDHSFFVDIQEIFVSWRLFTPILEAWQRSPTKLDDYEAGSFGPEASQQLLEQDGRYWHSF